MKCGSNVGLKTQFASSKHLNIFYQSLYERDTNYRVPSLPWDIARSYWELAESILSACLSGWSVVSSLSQAQGFLYVHASLDSMMSVLIALKGSYSKDGNI